MTQLEIEKLVIRMEMHAMGNLAPPSSGAKQSVNNVIHMFCNWPLTQLAEAVLGVPPLQIDMMAIVAEMKKRHPVVGHSPIATGNGGGGGARPYPPILKTLPTLEEMLAMRMRWRDDDRTGFNHVAIHRHGDIVHLWLITMDAQSTVLTDEYSLFPSDALITKLNLLKQE